MRTMPSCVELKRPVVAHQTSMVNVQYAAACRNLSHPKTPAGVTAGTGVSDNHRIRDIHITTGMNRSIAPCRFHTVLRQLRTFMDRICSFAPPDVPHPFSENSRDVVDKTDHRTDCGGKYSTINDKVELFPEFLVD